MSKHRYTTGLPVRKLPNLDAMSEDDLEKFAIRVSAAYRKTEGGPREREDLRHTALYARAKLDAKRARRKGEIAHALKLEKQCDTHYQWISPKVRWQS